MFESITITRHNSYFNSKPIDIGLLIECLLFYRKVIVVCDYDVLNQIYCYFGGDNLHRLLSEGCLDLFYLESKVGIITNGNLHDVTEFDSPQHRFQDKIREICIDARGSKGAGRRLAQRLEKNIKVSKDRKKVLEGGRESILNTRYASSSARIILNELVPSVPEIEQFRFDPHLSEGGIFMVLRKNWGTNFSPEHISKLLTLRIKETTILLVFFSTLYPSQNMFSKGYNRCHF